MASLCVVGGKAGDIHFRKYIAAAENYLAI
jgi:hypothetical protein